MATLDAELRACTVCGAPFLAILGSRTEGRRRCWPACRDAGGRRLTCPTCGRTFVEPRWTRRTYCSRACFRARRRGPCAACGDPAGWRPGPESPPLRRSGARFGIAGVLCHRCYVRLDSARRTGKRPEMPRQPSE